MKAQGAGPAKNLLCGFSAWLLLLLTAPSALGQSPPAGSISTSTSVSAVGLSDPAELEAFFDGVMAEQKEKLHIAGATVAVVADGELFFAKGYGYADVAKKKPVSVERTLFRIASVSKLFIWTAVMQLVEQGLLDLDADVNTYLEKFKIPNTYPEPITMAHLMTHTAGFEDHLIGLFARSEESLAPLDDLLEREMPARVRPPGEISSYSNYGAALAAYVVQQVSGTPWDEYIEKNILKPLGMERTTVRQPVPSALSGELAIGYDFADADGEHKEKGFEFIRLAPVGGMSATATDIARFMIAHLEGGRYGETRILSEATTRRMQTRLFTHHPALNGMLHGFIEWNRKGRRFFGHYGETFWFHTQLVLLPEYKVGLFVSYNSNTGGGARKRLVSAFLDKYFPAPADTGGEPKSPEPLADFAERAGDFEGDYTSSRVSHTTLAKLAILWRILRVGSTDDKRFLTLQWSRTGTPQKWIEVAPLLFQRPDGTGRMAFRRNENEGGRITHMFNEDDPTLSFVKLAPFQTPDLHYTLLGSSLFLFLSAVLLWPVESIRDRRGGIPPDRTRKTARLLAGSGGALCIAFVVAFVSVMNNPVEILFGVPPLLRPVLVLPLIAAVMVLGAMGFLVPVWKRGCWNLAGRLHYTMVAMAGLVFLGLLHYWNLLGFHFTP